MDGWAGVRGEDFDGTHLLPFVAPHASPAVSPVGSPPGDKAGIGSHCPLPTCSSGRSAPASSPVLRGTRVGHGEPSCQELSRRCLGCAEGGHADSGQGWCTFPLALLVLEFLHLFLSLLTSTHPRFFPLPSQSQGMQLLLSPSINLTLTSALVAWLPHVRTVRLVQRSRVTLVSSDS